MKASFHDHVVLFRKVIQDLQMASIETNLVIGGKWALKLHGLKMSTEPSDLDLILYCPNYKQREIFKEYQKEDTISDRPFMAIKEDYEGGTHFKVIKLENQGLFADIIKEDEPHPDGVRSLLIYETSGMKLPIQSIERVIEAKASYSFSKGTETENGVKLVKYMRAKDMLDFIDLKNSNFNTNE